MNREQQIKWWNSFCSNCKNEDCMNCKPPMIEVNHSDNDLFLDDFFPRDIFPFISQGAPRIQLITPPSNFNDMRNELEKRFDRHINWW